MLDTTTLGVIQQYGFDRGSLKRRLAAKNPIRMQLPCAFAASWVPEPEHTDFEKFGVLVGTDNGFSIQDIEEFKRSFTEDQIAQDAWWSYLYFRATKKILIGGLDTLMTYPEQDKERILLRYADRLGLRRFDEVNMFRRWATSFRHKMSWEDYLEKVKEGERQRARAEQDSWERDLDYSRGK